MLKRYSQLVLSFLFAADMAVAAGAWFLAYYVRFVLQFPVEPSKGHPPFSGYVAAAPLVALVCALCYAHRRLYAPRREGMFVEEAFDIVVANLYGVLVLAAIAAFYRDFSYSRLVGVLFAVLNSLALMGERWAVRSILRRLRKRGWNLRHVLIIGAGRLGQSIAERIERNAWTGLDALGYVDDDPQRQGKTIHGLPVVGGIDDLPRLIEETGADQLFVALPPEEHARLVRVMDLTLQETVDLRIVPDFRDFMALNPQIDDFDGLPVVSLRETPLHGWNSVIKRATDIVLSSAMIVVWAIPMGVIALMIKLLSPGPVFYVQERMGLDRRRFKMLKFRSMRVDAEAETGAKWATKDDARTTGVGAVLRRFSLDEIPQLLNVLVGDMSLVGPRPERPEFTGEFKKSIPGYMLRHKMKAGMTGWAQINGWRGSTSLEKRIQYDLYYIEHWSLGFDLWILFLTIFRGFRSEHAY